MLLPTTRDELIECAALIHAIRSGDLERIEIPQNALDILAQQIVAETAAEDWRRGRSIRSRAFALIRTAISSGHASTPLSRCCPTASPRREDGAARMLHRDQVNGRVRGRRGARLAAITSGGAIPETAALLRSRGARRQNGGHARRRLRDGKPHRRYLPAGYALLADPARDAGPRFRRRRARRRAVYPVLAGRSTGPIGRAIGRCRACAAPLS